MSKQGAAAGLLQTAMDASGLNFTTAPRSEGSAASRGGKSGLDGKHDSATSTSAGRGGRGVSRFADRGGARENVSSTGLEADLANRGKAQGSHASSGATGKAERLENTNPSRWPFAGTGGGGGGGRTTGREVGGTERRGSPPTGGGVSSSRDGVTGAISESTRGPGPGTTRGEASPPEPAPGGPKALKGLGGTGIEDTVDSSDGDGGRLRDSSGTDGRDASATAKPAVARRRGWGGGGGSGGGQKSGPGGGQTSSLDSSSPAVTGQGNSGHDGPVAIDSKASAEDILASMGLKKGLRLGPDGMAGGGAAQTPEDVMAGNGGGGDVQGKGNGGEGKRGLFGRLWSKKGNPKGR